VAIGWYGPGRKRGDRQNYAVINRRSHYTGRTWWEPYNLTSRDPVSIFNLRTGLDATRWSLIAWSKNLTNKIYNAEWGTGGFTWKAPPRTYGVDCTYRF
jgi:iron complex outermembrane receptor protein